MPTDWHHFAWCQSGEVRKAGSKVKPEVSIPTVEFRTELDLQAAVVHAAVKAIMDEQKEDPNYSFRTVGQRQPVGYHLEAIAALVGGGGRVQEIAPRRLRR